MNDPCDGSLCQNGGVCADGSCQCPENYTGKNCQEQVAPEYLRVVAIKVTRFPGTNQDLFWDPMDGPDIYFKLSEEEHPLAQPEQLVENANATQQYNFSFTPFKIRYVSSPHIMELYDYDGPGIPSQKLGEVWFTPYQSTNGFPKTLIIDDGGPVAFTMDVEYLYPNSSQ